MMFNTNIQKLYSLSSFKDQSQYLLLVEKINHDLRNYCLNLPDWEIKKEERFNKSIIFEVNKPQGSILGEIFKPRNPFKLKSSNNPHLDVEILMERVSNKLSLTITISEGNIDMGILGSAKLKFDPVRSLFLKNSNHVKELSTNIQNTISSIVQDSINEFEFNRVEKNIELKDGVLEEIEQLNYKEEIKSLLISNQNLFSDEHIQKILKVLDFYETNLTNYSSIYEKFKDQDFVNKFQTEINETFELLIPTYNSVLVIESYITEMINSLIKGDKVTYFSIFNVFEDQGVFLTKGEKIMIDNTNQLLHQLNQLNSSMDTLISLTVDISKKLSSINSKLMLNNFIQIVNTYQLDSINKKLG